MVLNTKIAFRITLAALIIIFALILYFVAFDKNEEPVIERVLSAIGFESSESEGSGAVPLPEGTISSTSGDGAGGDGGRNSGGTLVPLKFCTFNAYHEITSEVPCRCGFSGICLTQGSVCDATFNNGEGVCS